MRWLVIFALLACRETPRAPAAADAAVATAPPPPDAADIEALSAASPVAAPDGGVAPAPGTERTLRIAKPLRGTHAEKAPVFVARGDDPADLVKRALDGSGAKIPTDARVVIKVNAGGYDRMKPGK